MMMKTSLVRVSRVAALTAIKRQAAFAPVALQSTWLRYASSTKKKRDTEFGVPSEDYFDGHLMADHLEFLDDMIEKASVLEESLDNLKETHETFVQNVKWMDGQDIEQLLEPSRKQKEEIQ